MKFLIIFCCFFSFFCLKAMEEEDVGNKKESNNIILKLKLHSKDNLLINEEFVEKYQNLESLSLIGSTLNNNDISYLSKLQLLKKLNLINVEIKSLEPLVLLPHLKTLKLTYYNLQRDIDFLCNIASLKTLYIDGGYENIELLGRLINIKKLTLYRVLSDHPPKTSAPTLDFIINMKNLKKLSIPYNSSIYSIKPLTFLPNLKKLNIMGCENIKDLELLRECKKLRKLNIRGISGPYPIEKEDQEAIASLPHLKTLKTDGAFNIPINIKNIKIN